MKTAFAFLALTFFWAASAAAQPMLRSKEFNISMNVAIQGYDPVAYLDPETFKISNGKLFLFYHSWVNNTLNKWNKDEVNLQAKADANWTKFFH